MVVPVAVAIGGLAAALGLLLAYGHLRMRKAARAALSPKGYQEARVTINGRYHPDTVRVQQGIPVRIRFLREEDNPCSERVVFSHFGVDRRLPAFQETAVEFVPTAIGTFLFTCQWGMYRGKLVVTPARGRLKTAPTIRPEEKPGGGQRKDL
jgi:plastocyanin domain-containing protein